MRLLSECCVQLGADGTLMMLLFARYNDMPLRPSQMQLHHIAGHVAWCYLRGSLLCCSECVSASAAQLTASDCSMLQYHLLSRAKQCSFLLIFAAPVAPVLHACLLEGLKSCCLQVW
jgi:hypothetical protein